MRVVSLAQRALVRCLALALIATHAYADDELRHFDIQSQVAALALKEFARQADISLVFSSTVVANRQTTGIRGDFTVTEGLRKLLDGSGLSFKQVSATAIAINVARDPHEPDPPADTAAAEGSPAGSESQNKGDTNMTHRGFFTRLASALALTGAAVAGNHAYGQDTAADTSQAAAADPSAANTNNLDEVVVTATATGTKKLDASFEITTASLEEIRDASPLSSADLLKVVPGLWAESSGGPTGPNIEIAGYPGNSGAPYVTYSINGSPIYPSHNLSFMDDSSLFRLDDTVERAEFVVGGPSVVFSDGQLGATANFILRQGTDTPHGEFALTGGSEGMFRVDGFYGGPLAQDWRVSIGGYYQQSDGIRTSQFPAIEGGQLTGTLARTWDQGSILFYARTLNEKDLFITDIPLSVSGTGSNTSYSSFPGFNALTGYYAGNALQGLSVQECPGCAPLTANLADGRGTNINTFGNNLSLDLGGVQLDNKLQYTSGDVPTNAIFNGGSPPVTMSSFITSQIASANASTALTSAYGLASSGTATYAGTGTAVNPNAYVMENGFWVVDKHIQSFTDDLRFTFDVVPGNKLTVGGYFAAYSSDDTWYLGNNELMTATPNSQLINLTLNNGAIVSNNGLTSASTFTLVDHFQGTNAALFASDQWRLDQWLFDAGYRLEMEKVTGTIENDTTENLSTDPRNLYSQGVSVPNGSWMVYNCENTLLLGNAHSCDQFNRTKGSWTVGGTYEITPHESVYGRVDDGVYFPSFDDLRNGTPQTQSIYNYEVGYHVQAGNLYGNVNVYERVFSGVPFQQFVTNSSGALESITATYGARTQGITFQGTWQPIPHLTLGLSGDWQNDKYTGFYSGGSSAFDYTGNRLARQPRIQTRFTPAYDVPMPWGDVRLFLTYTYVGLRYSDPGNTEILPSYQTLDGGIVSDIGDHFEVRLQGTNLTNTLGLTEQDARMLTGGTAGGFALGRPIFGREVNLQLRYKF
jgi:outer membrane receptor protein involved in Fe transport